MRGSPHPPILQPTRGLVKAAPIPRCGIPPQMTGRPKSTQPRNKVPFCIRDWGISQYDARDRNAARWAFRDDPETLRRQIAETILAHPGYTNCQFNRLLNNAYGARIAELNELFGRRGMSQLTDIIFNYDRNCQDLMDIANRINQTRRSGGQN